MKNLLHIFFSAALIAAAFQGKAQFTELTSNNAFDYGINLNGKVIFESEAGSLWSTDGTAAGTAAYAANVFVDPAGNLNLFAGKIYFTGIDAVYGSELWVTDGTDAGTHIVKDIVSGTDGSAPTDFYFFNNVIYFFASTAAEGKELWKSDGTDAGTVFVKDINPGAAGSYGTLAYFFAANNILYFTADDGTNANELWKTDGTEAGTQMVKDINPGDKPSNANSFTLLGTQVIFAATDKTNGTELWKTDGTDAGTVLIKDILPGAGLFGSSSPSQFLLFNGKLYFTITDLLNGGQSLYVTDGTKNGTKLINSALFYSLINSVFINNKFYFSAYTTANGSELWSSDGTVAGTALFKDINSGNGSSAPFIMLDYFEGLTGGTSDVHTILYNGNMFFTADDGINGTELWVTDGTDAGTQMVKDINPAAPNNIFSYWYTNEGLFFGASDGATGVEVWKSDGTELGTIQSADVNVGAGSSDPTFLGILNEHLLFNANNGDGDFPDLYSLDETVGTLPITISNFTAALFGKSVQLKWNTSSEINSSHFEIERSKNGLQFESIGLVNAAGNSTNEAAYQFIDEAALHIQTDKLYYRLRMIDKDGQSAQSKIAIINIVPDARLFYMYPNPVKEQLQVVVNSQEQKQTAIRITDQNGKQVYTRQLNNAAGSYQYNVNVAMLAKGLYFIQLITDKGIQTIKFIKN